MIGLAGAQRTGKSTLAQAWAEATKVPFLVTSASGTYARLGLNPKVDYDFATRLAVQTEILNDAELVYRQGRRGMFITDRTPLDFMAYLLADVTRNNVSGENAELLGSYIARCYQVLNSYFQAVLIVPPGIPLVEAEGKASANPSHMEHINALVMGLASDPRYENGHWFVPRDYLTIEKRLTCLDYINKRLNDRHASFLAARKEAGDPVIFH